MKTLFRCKTLFVLGAILCIAPLNISATPVLTMQLHSGATTITVAPTSGGQITYMGAVGNFSVNLIGVFGSPVLALPQILDLSSFNATGKKGGTLTITLSELNMTSPAGFNIMNTSVGGTLSNGSSILFQTFYDPTNVAFATGPLLASCSVNTNPFTCNTFTPFNLGSGPYGLTEIVTITEPAKSNVSFDLNLQSQVPEPSSLALLGTGLLTVGGLVRRKFLSAQG